MLRILFVLGLSTAALSPCLFAQEKAQDKAPEKVQEKAPAKEDYTTMNRKAIDALRAKKFDDGIAILNRMLEIGPKEQRKGTAYNLACAYALKGDADKAFEWIDKGMGWGWGAGQGSLDGTAKQIPEVEMTKTDPDLESLRKDPRFDKAIERMSKALEAHAAFLKKGEEYAATAATYIPEKIAAAKEMPLLVVLHDGGSTKDEVVKGPWKAIADELGFALIAPSGKIPIGEDPAKGMTWYESIDDYNARTFVFEKPVNDAVSAFKKEHGIDKSQVVVVGEGVGGIVALDVAVNGPGLYKGAVTLNANFIPQIYAAKAPSAGKMGLRAALLIDGSKILKDALPEGGIAKLAEGQNKSLQSWGLAGETKVFTPDGKDVTEPKVLVEAIRSVLTRTAATPASAPAGESATPKK